MKIKIYSILCIALLSVCNISAQTFEVDGINYNVTGANEVEVTSKSGCYSGDVVIPETVDDSGTTYNVTAIGFEAFRTCLDVTSINLPNSITEIKDFAFGDCRNITTMTLPESVTLIGEGAFLYCTILESINIPNQVTTINMHVFSQCSKLTSITIPELVTSIGTYAFSNCTSLTTVSVNLDTPINIASQVFYNLDLSQMVLNVPTGSESAYNSASVWQDFGSINGTLGSKTYESPLKLAVYPNPTSNNISISGIKQPIDYIIYNVVGEYVLKGVVSKNDTIKIENLTNGLYFLKLENGTSMKFLKK